MAINYCDWVTGDDVGGDGSAGNPYKTITIASTGLIAGDEVRVGKSPDVTALSGTIAWVQGDHTFVTSVDLTGEIAQGDFISKGIGWPWGETLYEVSNVGVDFVEVYATYPGATETVASFKIETTDTDTDPASTTKVQELMSSGAFGSPIKISGGWDLTTETKTGHTYFRQVHTTFSLRYGYGLWSSQKYIEIGNLSFLRYRYGLRFNSASDTELTSAHLNSNASYGLYIYNTGALIVNQVLCVGNFSYGTYIYSLSESSLNNLRAYSNYGAGIYLYNSHNNNFVSLRMCFNNSYGLYARYSEGNIFSATTVSDNGNHGLYFYYMCANRFTDSNIINNNRGVYLYKSFENIFATAQIDDHSTGIYSYQAFNNRLYNLSMQGNTDDFYIVGRGKSEVPVLSVGRYQEDNLDLWYFDDGHCETCRTSAYFLDVESIKFHSTSNSIYIYHSWFAKVCKGDARKVSIWMRDDAIHHPTVYGTLYFKEKAVNSATLLDLSVPGWHKFEFIPTTANWIIDNGFLELRIQVTGSCDCWADRFSAYTSEDVMQYLVEMRGEDDDTLKTLSDQLDVVQDDLDTPDQYKANVAPLALEDGGRIEETQNHIKHAEYGLQALKAIFDEIKGAGWSDESLVSLSETLEWVLSATAIKLVTVAMGATTTLFTTDLIETMDDFWNRGALVFITGQCTGQMRKIHDYDGGTKQITLYTPLSYAPAVDDTFLIITERNFRTNIDDNEAIADEVWDEPLSEHTGNSTFGGLQSDIKESNFNGFIHVCDDCGLPGTDYPLGTPTHPVDNISDAITIAQTQNLCRIKIKGIHTLLSSISGHCFEGCTGVSGRAKLILNNQDISNCCFSHLIIEGASNGYAQYEDSCALQSLTNFEGVVRNSDVFTQDSDHAIEFKPNGIVTFSRVCAIECDVFVKPGAPTCANLHNFCGRLHIMDMTAGIFTICSSTSQVVIYDTCIGGTINICGNILVTDNSGPGCTVNDTTVRVPLANIQNATEARQGLISAVGATTTLFTTDLTETMDDFWNRGALIFTSGQCRGQMRKIHDYDGGTKQITLYTPLAYAPAFNDTFVIVTARNFRTNIADNNLIADTVWDEPESEHIAMGSFGKKIGKLTLDADDNIHAVIKDAGTVPQDVWQEHTYDHEDPDTFGYTNQYQVPSDLASNIEFLLKIIKNKKELKKNVDVWELIIYNDDNVTPILNKEMKDKDDNNITDLEAGILAQELKDSV